MKKGVDVETVERELADGMREGLVIAALVDGEVVFYHAIHVENIPKGAPRLSISDVAQRGRWDWWFEQN